MPQEQPRRRALVPSLAALLTAVVVATSACGGFGRQPGSANPVMEREEEPQEISVQVRNNAWAAIHVYAIMGAQWESLGVVSSQNTADYTIPRGMIGGRGEIRLVADPIGSTEGYFSDPILVEPGDRVEWTLQNNLALSSVMVR